MFEISYPYEQLCYIGQLECNIASVFASSSTSLAIVDGVLELCDGALSQHIVKRLLISYAQHAYAADSNTYIAMLEGSEAGHNGFDFA